MVARSVTALHEASHAVVAHVLGVEVRSVRLLDRGGGRTELGEADARRALLIAVAGDVGERVLPPIDPAMAWRL